MPASSGVVADLDDRGRDREFLPPASWPGQTSSSRTREPDEYDASGGSIRRHCSKRHPHLVAVSISAYGRSGPWADRPGTAT